MAAVTMNDLLLEQPAELSSASKHLEDTDLAYRMQLYEALYASSEMAKQQGISAEADAFTRTAIAQSETEEQREALRLQQEEIERARQAAADDLAASTAEKEAAAQYKRERSDAKLARYLADLSDDEWEDYGDTYDINTIPRGERDFPDQVQLRCVGIEDGSRAGAGAMLIGSNNLTLLEFSPQLEGPHSSSSAEVQVIIEGLRAARAFGLRQLKLVVSPFVMLKLSGSAAPLNPAEMSALSEVDLLVQELDADVRAVPLDRNRRALRLARASLSKYRQETPGGEDMQVESSQESCPICMEIHSPSAMFSFAPCNHSFCKECVSQHASVRVRARALPVVCPHPSCHSELSRNDCEAVLPPDVFGLLLDIQAENCIPGEERVYCPYKDCCAMMVLGDMGQGDVAMSSSHPHRTAVGQVECVNCQRMFCLECHVPWHLNMTCRQYQDLPLDQRALEDVKLHNLAADKKWKQCPNCKRMIELAEGCHHMTCVCGEEFCYLCASLWRRGHATCECPLFNDVEEENEEQVRIDYEAERRRRLAVAYKTRLCVHFMRGHCRHGEWCRFAHGQYELRHPEDNME